MTRSGEAEAGASAKDVSGARWLTLNRQLIRYCFFIQYSDQRPQPQDEPAAAMPLKVPDNTRIVKRLAPHEPGTLKLTRRYGSALVCVRYRHDETGQHRYTTVELIVDDAPIIPRGRPDEMVGVRIAPEQSTLRSRAYARGATWDRNANLWLMPRRLASALRLAGSIVKVLP